MQREKQSCSYIRTWGAYGTFYRASARSLMCLQEKLRTNTTGRANVVYLYRSLLQLHLFWTIVQLNIQDVLDKQCNSEAKQWLRVPVCTGEVEIVS